MKQVNKKHRHIWNKYINPNGQKCRCGKRKNASRKIY